ncbi:unnamed protein product [Protopolystoma xenopodis]|uniref:Uncharacterized protein n=1 Tax=Protopolystoma xenopodis TaxID=117903 RepID=A0A3S5AFD6_9PLAT|nr:unnamed protein product [Protopolystoma xenopodis]
MADLPDFNPLLPTRPIPAQAIAGLVLSDCSPRVLIWLSQLMIFQLVHLGNHNPSHMVNLCRFPTFHLELM